MSRRKGETLPTPTHVGLTTCGHGDPDLDVTADSNGPRHVWLSFDPAHWEERKK